MEWISVKDRLPELNETVLVIDAYDLWDGKYHYSVGERCQNKGEEEKWVVVRFCEDPRIEPTHWMPFAEFKEE